jgi:hypothetical protein
VVFCGAKANAHTGATNSSANSHANTNVIADLNLGMHRRPSFDWH